MSRSKIYHLLGHPYEEFSVPFCSQLSWLRSSDASATHFELLSLHDVSIFLYGGKAVKIEDQAVHYPIYEPEFLCYVKMTTYEQSYSPTEVLTQQVARCLRTPLFFCGC